jgi:hypothetical protein
MPKMLRTTTADAALVEFAGHLMKQCAACPTLFNLATPGALCPECTFPLTCNGAEWVTLADITATTHALYPATRRIPHIYVERPA